MRDTQLALAISTRHCFADWIYGAPSVKVAGGPSGRRAGGSEGCSCVKLLRPRWALRLTEVISA